MSAGQVATVPAIGPATPARTESLAGVAGPIAGTVATCPADIVLLFPVRLLRGASAKTSRYVLLERGRHSAVIEPVGLDAGEGGDDMTGREAGFLSLPIRARADRTCWSSGHTARPRR